MEKRKKMKLVLSTIKIIHLLSHSFAADFEVTMTGKAEYPYFKEYEKDKIFSLPKQETGFLTKLMIGNHKTFTLA